MKMINIKSIINDCKYKLLSIVIYCIYLFYKAQEDEYKIISYVRITYSFLKKYIIYTRSAFREIA